MHTFFMRLIVCIYDERVLMPKVDGEDLIMLFNYKTNFPYFRSGNA